MTTTPTTSTSIPEARFRDLSEVDCLDVALCTSTYMHEVMNQKVAEKKAVAQAAMAELATYRKVQAHLAHSAKLGTAVLHL